MCPAPAQDRPIAADCHQPSPAPLARSCDRRGGHAYHSAGKPRGQTFAVFAKPTLKTDDVEIDRRLVAAYDAVAQLPGGEPVRFHCREWADNVVLRDQVRGVVIEQRTPRMEIVPVRIETY
jgi:hypothetical protein